LTDGNDFDLYLMPGLVVGEIYVTVRSKSIDALIAFVQQFAWLSACLQSGNPETVVSSSIRTVARNEMVTVKLLKTETMPKSDSACWYPLLSHYVVAEGFPTPERHDERGIELPYHVMTTFGRIRYPEPYLKGIILMGLSTILVPFSKTESSVQWHFISRSHAFEHMSLQATMNEEGIKDDHVLEGSGLLLLEKFESENMRHFVGCYENANIHLGTQDSSYSEAVSPPVDVAEDAGREVLYHRHIRANFMGFGPGTSSASVGGSIEFSKSKRDQIQDDELSLTDLVRRTKDNVCIIYDAKEKTGWAVPELSIIIHLVHAWAAQTKNGNHTGQYPFANLSGNGGQAAHELVMKHRNAALADIYDPNETTTFEKRVRITYLALRSLRHRLLSKDRNTAKAPTWPKKLCGYNFADLVELGENIGKCKVTIDTKWSGGWESIPLNEPEIMVIMAHKIGDIIQPAPGALLCSSWQTIPKGKYLLVASVPCITRMSRRLRAEEETSKLSPKHYCHRRGSLFEPCQGSPRGGCQRIQKLDERRPEPQESLWFPADLQDGAVVFGGASAVNRLSRRPCTAGTTVAIGSTNTTSTASSSTLIGNHTPSLPVGTGMPISAP
jgi:hypothetical protein